MSMDFGAAGQPAPPADLIKQSSTAGFRADVLDASMTTPVLVDFWAPWCGPCRQLTPTLEKVVTAYAGKLKLVKVNIDENQALAGQMGIQSIPAVFAFSGGRPVDGFMGALPETEVRRFVDKLLAAAGAGGDAGDEEDGVAEALAAAQEAMAANDLATAEQIYATILDRDPGNDDALLGLATLYVKVGRKDGVESILGALSDEGRKRPEYAALRTALDLAAEAEALEPIDALEARVAGDPDDHQARYELALALAGKGFRAEAAEALVAIIAKDRAWNEDGARKKLLELFEAWGPKDPATARGRRLLSAALFS